MRGSDQLPPSASTREELASEEKDGDGGSGDAEADAAAADGLARAFWRQSRLKSAFYAWLEATLLALSGQVDQGTELPAAASPKPASPTAAAPAAAARKPVALFPVTAVAAQPPTSNRAAVAPLRRSPAAPEPAPAAPPLPRLLPPVVSMGADSSCGSSPAAAPSSPLGTPPRSTSPLSGWMGRLLFNDPLATPAGASQQQQQQEQTDRPAGGEPSASTAACFAPLQSDPAAAPPHASVMSARPAATKTPVAQERLEQPTVRQLRFTSMATPEATATAGLAGSAHTPAAAFAAEATSSSPPPAPPLPPPLAGSAPSSYDDAPTPLTLSSAGLADTPDPGAAFVARTPGTWLRQLDLQSPPSSSPDGSIAPSSKRGGGTGLMQTGSRKRPSEWLSLTPAAPHPVDSVAALRGATQHAAASTTPATVTSAGLRPPNTLSPLTHTPGGALRPLSVAGRPAPFAPGDGGGAAVGSSSSSSLGASLQPPQAAQDGPGSLAAVAAAGGLSAVGPVEEGDDRLDAALDDLMGTLGDL